MFLGPILTFFCQGRPLPAAKEFHDGQISQAAHDRPNDLEPGLFANGSPQQVAAALKKSAQDPRRNSRTAMSMLDFYVNRAGDKLSAEQRAKLDQAKMALRQAFGR
jgi:hypothetical protein